MSVETINPTSCSNIHTLKIFFFREGKIQFSILSFFKFNPMKIFRIILIIIAVITFNVGLYVPRYSQWYFISKVICSMACVLLFISFIPPKSNDYAN